jgi:hypothetical protein
VPLGPPYPAAEQRGPKAPVLGPKLGPATAVFSRLAVLGAGRRIADTGRRPSHRQHECGIFHTARGVVMSLKGGLHETVGFHHAG